MNATLDQWLTPSHRVQRSPGPQCAAKGCVKAGFPCRFRCTGFPNTVLRLCREHERELAGSIHSLRRDCPVLVGHGRQTKVQWFRDRLTSIGINGFQAEVLVA